MSRAAVILRNVASNWGGFVVSAAVTLALTPFVLHHLGPARYGVWILTSSIFGYYGLLDVGFRAGVTQYLTRYLAVGDYGKASECLSTAVAVLAGLGAVMFGLSLGAAYIAPHVFNLPGEMEREAFWCILIVGCSTAIQFALCPFISVFTATQRFDLGNLIGVITRLLTAGGIVVSLTMGQGLIGLSAATFVVSSLDYVIRWRVARRLAPQITVAWRHASLERVREIGAFGAWNFLITIQMFVTQQVPSLLIGLVMPIAAVGHYALASGLMRQIHAVLSPVGPVIYPAATQLHFQGDRPRLERLYHDGSRFVLLATISIVLLASFWAEDFYRVWIGGTYLTGSPFQSVAWLFRILLIGVATTYFSIVAGQILTGTGHVRLLAKALMCGSVINLGISVLLVGRYGLAGVAAGAVIASIAIDFIVVPLLLQRAVGLSIREFVRRACVRPAAVGVIQAALLWCIRLSGPATDWPHLVLQGALAGAVSVAVVLVVGVTAGERDRFLLQPLRRLGRGEGAPKKTSADLTTPA